MYLSKNILEDAIHSENHPTLVLAVEAASPVDTLEGLGPFPVFAPTYTGTERDYEHRRGANKGRNGRGIVIPQRRFI